MASVVSLEELSQDSLGIAGGKGANLGELIRQGFPVPPGFVATASAYCEFIDGWDLTAMSPGQIRSKIISTAVSDSLAANLHTHHDRLQSKLQRPFVYAVRSSATAEDLGDASFAGQHDTYYYVTAQQLPEMVKQCWASMWSDAACSYRNSQGVAHEQVHMAVVVQLMVESDISGITFTANPVTGNRDEIITEASWGMGAAIVDGRVSPDQYTYSRQQQQLLKKRIADKKFMVPATLSEGQSRLIPVPASLRRKETLSPEQVSLLNRWAIESETYFGKPQDLEWAFHGDEFYILQSRPITTLTQTKEQIPDGEFVLFKPIAENFTDPLLPLSQDIFLRLFPMMNIIHGRIYVNIKIVRPLLPFKLNAQQIAQLAYLSDMKDHKPRLSILKLPGLAAILYLNYLLMGVFYYRTSSMPDDFMNSFRDLFNKVVDDDEIDAPGAMEKLFFKSRFFEPAGNMVFLANISAPRYVFLLELLARLLRLWLPNLRDDAASYLTSGSEGILSTDMGRRIWRLAEEARRSPAVIEIVTSFEPRDALPLLRNNAGAQPFMREVNQFLAIHGHRTLKEFELNSVRWEEDPTPIIAMVRNYLQSDVNPTQTEHVVEEQRKQFAAEIRTALQDKFLESSLGIRWRIIEALRKQAKYFIRLRENSRFYHIMGFYAVRKKVVKAEGELLDAGKLKCKDDIFYLQWQEIKALRDNQLTWLEVESRIRERRMEFIRLSKMSPPKTFGIQLEEDLEQDENHQIRGQGASPGEFEGIARVIMDPGIDATVIPGEILIAPYTDPAWTPLFLTASAAVVEVGSYLSHAGTIAREYGLPCVVDAANCTERIKTGDRIRVNGSTGLVAIVDTREDATDA